MARSKFSSVAEAQRVARRKVPRSVCRAFPRENRTTCDHLRALSEVGFRLGASR